MKLSRTLIPISLLALALGIALVSAALAQAPGNVEWVRQFGGVGPATDIAQAVDTDGNVYVAGRTAGTFPGETSAGGDDAFVRKYDSDGNVLWTRQFGTSSTDQARGISLDSTGVYVAGRTRGTLPGQFSAGRFDVFVRKYDSDGNQLWTDQFGSSSNDDAPGLSVESSGVYVAGWASRDLPGQTRVGGTDAFVRKYDSDGNQQWTRQFGTSTSDQASSISVNSSGVYVVGWTRGDLGGLGNAGSDDGFLRKYDFSGTDLWTRQFGTSSRDQPTGVSVDSSGVHVAGSTQGSLGGTNAGGWDTFVFKYDSAGTNLLTSQFGTSSNDFANGVSSDSSGAYVAGSTRGSLGGTNAGGSDAFVRKYDSGGTDLWTKQFGSSLSDDALGIAVDSSGAYVAGQTGGTLPGQTSAGRTDAFVRKYDSGGNELWTRQFGSLGPVFDNAASVDVGDGVYVVGVAGILPGQVGFGETDVYVRKYDRSGNELWTRQFGTSSFDSANGVSADSSGVYVAGLTRGTLPGQTSAGSGDAFVRKYDFDGTELWTRQFGSSAYDEANGISADSSGVYVTGRTAGRLPGQSKTSVEDAFVRKYDSDGNELWTSQFGVRAYINRPNGVSADPSGAYVAGFAMSSSNSRTRDAFVRKYDTEGTPLWTRIFGSTTVVSDSANGVSADSSGVYVVGGVSGALPGQTSAGGTDAFVRRYNSDGTEEWTRQFGTPATDNAAGVSLDSSGAYVVGQTRGTFPGETNAGSGDAFVRKYDDNGTELWTRQIGTSSNDSARGVSVDSTDIFVAGTTSGTFLGQTSAGSTDAFVLKISFNRAPTADAGEGGTIEWTGEDVSLDGSGSEDPDGDTLSYSWTQASGPTTTIANASSAETTFTPSSLGTYTFNLTVTDPSGLSDSDVVTITVEDTTAPVIAGVVANPDVLWPPNHKMRAVTVAVDVSDACDTSPTCRIVAVASNEDANGTGDGNTEPDWVTTGDLTLDLRAERSGQGAGRIYTITIECTDSSGNRSTTDVVVTVPHDQSQGKSKKR